MGNSVLGLAPEILKLVAYVSSRVVRICSGSTDFSGFLYFNSSSVQSRAHHWPLLKATGASSMSTGAKMTRYKSYEVRKCATIFS